MGNSHAHPGRRLAPALILTMLVLLALLALGASRITENASAQSTFTACASCHTSTAVHAGTTHSGTGCGTCHINGTGSAPAPSACASCHGGATGILAKATHTANGCGTTAGCHGVPQPTPPPAPPVAGAITVKAPSAASVKKGKTASLKYRVNEAVLGGVANVKIVIKNAKKKAVKTLKVTGAKMNMTNTAKFKCKLAKGKYKFYVSATTAAGAKSTNTASNKLKVK